MVDKFKEVKGVIGKELAKLYLKHVKGFDIIGEEICIEGYTRGRFDLLVQEGKIHRPVEVKFQEFNIDYLGEAFERIIRKLNKGKPVYALHNKRYICLEKPILFLWYPPKKSFKNKKKVYKNIEVIQFGEALKAIKAENISYSNRIAKNIANLVREFFDENDLGISPQRMRNLQRIFNISYKY